MFRFSSVGYSKITFFYHLIATVFLQRQRKASDIPSTERAARLHLNMRLSLSLLKLILFSRADETWKSERWMEEKPNAKRHKEKTVFSILFQLYWEHYHKSFHFWKRNRQTSNTTTRRLSSILKVVKYFVFRSATSWKPLASFCLALLRKETF